MTVTDYMQHSGQPAFLRGYSAVFDRPSVPIADNGGLREIVREMAFDRVVRNLPLRLGCVVHHVDAGPGLVASTYTGDLKIWTDSHGLAFEAGPLKATLENHWMLEEVVKGRLRGCSWLATPADYRVETINGEEFRIIEDFKSVEHIGPVSTGTGAYPDACSWASYERLQDLTPELQQVIDFWEHNRAAAEQRIEAKRKPAIAASVRAQVRTPSVDDEDWLIPPLGFSREEWATFGFRDAAGRRAMRLSRRGRRWAR